MGLLDDAIREHLELKRRRGADPSEVARQENDALGPVRRDPTPSAVDSMHEDAERYEAGVGPADEAHDAPAPSATPDHAAAEAHDDLREDDIRRAEADAIPATDPREHGEWTGEPIADPRETAGRGGDAAREPHVREAAGRGGVDRPDVREPENNRADADDEVRAPRGAASSEPIISPDQPTVEYRVEDHEAATERADRAGRAADTDKRDAENRADAPHPRDAETDRFDTVDRSGAGERPGRDAPGGGGARGQGDEDEDVLEETPDFLQETPEHDRLWFEQRPPRDFDFDG